MVQLRCLLTIAFFLRRCPGESDVCVVKNVTVSNASERCIRPLESCCRVLEHYPSYYVPF